MKIIEFRPKVRVFVKDGKMWTTSRDVHQVFEMDHKEVLRAIRNLKCSEEFRRRNFAPSSYINEQNKDQPMYDISRDGWTFLVMGFNSPKAARFKEKWIEEWNRMEEHLHDQSSRLVSLSIEIGELQTQATRILLKNDDRLDRLTDPYVSTDQKADKAIQIASEAMNCVRREISPKTKSLHRRVWLELGCRCNICGDVSVKHECDHYCSPKWNEFTHTWPLCCDCHHKITHGYLDRGAVKSAFDNYQRLAANILAKKNQQILLFSPPGRQVEE